LRGRRAGRFGLLRVGFTGTGYLRGRASSGGKVRGALAVRRLGRVPAVWVHLDFVPVARILCYMDATSTVPTE
jgi:hypothetical protein